MKTCSTCGESKPYSEFWKSRNGRTKDGYKGECKDCATARRRKWAAQNKDKEAEYNRRRYQKNPAKYIGASKEWAEANPERAKESKRNREAKRRARRHSSYVENVDPKKVFERDGGVCQICGDSIGDNGYHINHVIPLVKGGMHSYANTQLAHPRCNLVKGAS